MKFLIQIFALTACILINAASLFAQEQYPDSSILESGRIEPYRLFVTYDKTTHLIFPANIRYVDLGSGYLIADKAAGAENVLRVKAAIPSFDAETNFSVVTEDGRFYNFNAFYSPNPPTLNYDLLKMTQAGERLNTHDVLFEELGGTSPSFIESVLETIYNRNKREIKHIGSRGYGVQVLLKGIYIDKGKYYFLISISNKTSVPFNVDFISFKIVDKKIAKRTVIQEQSLKPLRVYRPVAAMSVRSSERNVFMLDQFTLADDKVLVIEVFERNGGRGQTMQVENSDLIHAKLVSNMHLKIIKP